MIAAALAMSLAVTPAQFNFPAPPAPTEMWGQPADMGGRIGDYIDRLVSAKGMNPIPATCASACTIFFGSSHYCIVPGTVAYFHPAYRIGVENPWQAMDKQATLSMKTFYPPKLRAYTDAHHFWDDPDWKTLEYHQLVSLGVLPCKQR